MASKRAKLLVKVFALFVAIGLLLLWIFKRGKLKTQQAQADLIIQILTSKGMDLQTAKQWVTVSALETAGWTANVYKNTHNLFALIIPGKPGYGSEGQTIFATDAESVEALYKSVIKYWDYPLNFSSIQAQAEFMKSKWYYGGDVATYVKNMVYWWNKFFV